VLKIKKHKWIIVIMLNIVILALGGFYIRHLHNHRGVTCMDCFRMTNYLYNTEQPRWPEEEESHNIFENDTVEGLAHELRRISPWKCESCAYRHAKELMYPEKYLFPLLNPS